MSNSWGCGKTERTWAMLRDGFGNKENLPGAGMNNDLLLDTDIIVNVGRGHADAVAQMSAMMVAGQVHISAVTEMELVIG
jgi:hypothetical protein